MDTSGLTTRQLEVLEYIQAKTHECGYPPTIREIGQALGLSSSATVHSHLATLESKGFIRRDGSKSRSIMLVEDDSTPSTPPSSLPSNVVSLPVVGRVAAGAPILAEQNIEDTFILPKEIAGDGSSFLLKVKGDSMIEAGIFDGDYVVVREQATADNGDIVVALIDDGATVKTYYREQDRIRLQPQNPTMEPIYTRDAIIAGKVTALFRTV